MTQQRKFADIKALAVCLNVAGLITMAFLLFSYAIAQPMPPAGVPCSDWSGALACNPPCAKQTVVEQYPCCTTGGTPAASAIAPLWNAAATQPAPF